MHEHDFTQAAWRKSSKSQPNNANCVEVADLGDDAIAVRHSKRTADPPLVFTHAEWTAFVAGAKDGEFDLNC